MSMGTERETNFVKFVNKYVSCTLEWIVDPFGSILSTLAVNESHVIESPVLCTWWHDEWKIKLTFTRRLGSFFNTQGYQQPITVYGPKITLINLNETKSETSAYKVHNFKLTAEKAAQEYITIHDKSALESSFVDTNVITWSQIEPLKLCIKLDFFPHGTVPALNPMVFRFHEKLASLKEAEAFNDVTICVDGQNLRCNKTVLALISPVFYAMFSHDFKEKQDQIVHIEDSNTDTIKTFLDFAYTGQSPVFVDITSALKLFYFSDKYQVPALKNICLRYISSYSVDEKEENINTTLS